MQDLVEINESTEEMVAEFRRKFSLDQDKAEQVRTRKWKQVLCGSFLDCQVLAQQEQVWGQTEKWGSTWGWGKLHMARGPSNRKPGMKLNDSL